MREVLTIDELAAAVLRLDAAIVDDSNWGERALFYNPGRQRAKGIYIATFKLRDGANDSASLLGDGAHRYRFNISLSRADYEALFGPKPDRPPAGGVVATGHDFAEADRLMPHPVYAWMHWAAIVNPSPARLDELAGLAERAIGRARKKWKA